MKRPGDFFQKGIDYLSAALLGTVIILVVFFSNVPRYISKSFLLPNGTLVLIAVGGWLLFVGACRFISEKRHLRLTSDEEGGEKQHMVDRAVVGLCVCLFFGSSISASTSSLSPAGIRERSGRLLWPVWRGKSGMKCIFPDIPTICFCCFWRRL